MNDIPPQIFRNRDGSMRLVGWFLLALILAVFCALYFFGVLPHQAAYSPV